jgi:hypothetical protein
MTKVLLWFAFFIWLLPFLALGGVLIGAQLDLLPIRSERDFWGTVALVSGLIEVCKVFGFIGIFGFIGAVSYTIGKQR